MVLLLLIETYRGRTSSRVPTKKRVKVHKLLAITSRALRTWYSPPIDVISRSPPTGLVLVVGVVVRRFLVIVSPFVRDSRSSLILDSLPKPSTSKLISSILCSFEIDFRFCSSRLVLTLLIRSHFLLVASVHPLLDTTTPLLLSATIYLHPFLRSARPA